MRILASTNGSYPRIGDTARQQILRQTIDLWEKGKKTEAELRAAQDTVTRDVMAEQLEAGIDLPTDGQVRWYDPISHLMGKLEHVKITGLLRWFDTNYLFRQPVAENTPLRKKPLLVEEFRFAKQHSPKPVKVVLTGPYTLAAHSIRPNGVSLAAFVEQLTQALAQEVAELAKEGAEWIQLDEPSILKQPKDLPLVANACQQFARAKGKAKLVLTTYFGDATPLYEALQQLNIDALGLDFTYSPKLAEKILSTGSGKTLFLGLVDGRNTKLEKPKDVAAQVEKLGAKVKAAEVYPQPSCGLEYLPRDRAFDKLKLLSQVKKLLS